MHKYFCQQRFQLNFTADISIAHIQYNRLFGPLFTECQPIFFCATLKFKCQWAITYKIFVKNENKIISANRQQ